MAQTSAWFSYQRVEDAYDRIGSEVRSLRSDGERGAMFVWFPSHAGIEAFRQRVGSIVGVRLVAGRELAEEILRQKGRTYRVLGDEAQSRFLYQAAKTLKDEGVLEFVGEVWNRAGFLQVLQHWIAEMRGQEISPAMFAAHAQQHGSALEHDLAALYARYEEMLHARGVFDEGQVWGAVRDILRQEDAETSKRWNLWRVEVGHRSPLEDACLASLVGAGACVRLFAPWDAQRADESAALDTFREGHRSLTEGRLSQILEEAEALTHQKDDEKAYIADVVLDGFGEVGEKPLSLDVSLLEASSRESELRWVMRDVKERLFSGERASKIAILSAQSETYRKGAEAIASEYGVPLSAPVRLQEQSLGLFLQKLLSIAGEFPWLDTMQVLRSPYLMLPWFPDDDIELLDQLTRERPVIRGIAQWEAALHKPTDALLGGEEDEDDIFEDRKLIDRLSEEDVARIHKGLSQFFALLTPPEKETWQGYRLWAERAFFGLAGVSTKMRQAEAETGEVAEEAVTLGLWKHLRQGGGTQRDLRVLQVIRGQLYELEAVDALLTQREGHDAAFDVEDVVAWEEFQQRWSELLRGRSVSWPHRASEVYFGALEQARERSWDRVYVLGMAEGEFPRVPAPDVLYAPQEREEHPLPLRKALKRSEDGSLWWQCLQQTRSSLILTRPCFDEKGTELAPSPYWEDLLRRVPSLAQKHRSQEQVFLKPEQTASTGELLVAMAMQDATEVPEALTLRWQAVQRAYTVMNYRLGEGAPGIFEGMLQAPDILEELGKLYGEEHRWSVSRLNRYGKCPYGFFANYILRLEPLPDPEEGMDVKQWGILLHWILEKIFLWMSQEQIAPTPDTEAQIMEELERLCQQAFRKAEAGLSFRPSFLWRYEQQEIRKMLSRLIRHECQENAKDAYVPLFQELKFGMEGSGLDAFVFESQAGVRFQLNGIIDRVDRHPDGHLRIVDYKSGSSTFSLADVSEGRSLQAALYALVSNALLMKNPEYAAHFSSAPEVMRSYYLHLPTRKKSGNLDLIDKRRSKKAEAVLGVAGERAASFVEKVRMGQFPSSPSAPSQGDGACSAHCDLASLCRVTRQSLAKTDAMSFFVLAGSEENEEAASEGSDG
ncbi:MAG: PD-(D/E)XK nuclease family protein [Myxococcales bacterium]|nr:PD-(D/E)XK nuclease family protein [Myxococcales bacterium]